MILAIEIPDISAVINMLGSLAAVFIFVFPGICLLQTALTRWMSSRFWKSKNFISSDPGLVTRGSKVRIAGAFAFLLLGAFLFGVVLTQVIYFCLESFCNCDPGFDFQPERHQQVHSLVFDKYKGAKSTLFKF